MWSTQSSSGCPCQSPVHCPSGHRHIPCSSASGHLPSNQGLVEVPCHIQRLWAAKTSLQSVYSRSNASLPHGPHLTGHKIGLQSFYNQSTLSLPCQPWTQSPTATPFPCFPVGTDQSQSICLHRRSNSSLVDAACAATVELGGRGARESGQSINLGGAGGLSIWDSGHWPVAVSIGAICQFNCMDVWGRLKVCWGLLNAIWR